MGRPMELYVYAFLREACEDDDYANVADSETAYNKLRTLQRGKYTSVTNSGTTLISSTVSGKTFSFQVSGALAPEQIISVVESALQVVDKVRTASAVMGVTDESLIVKAIKRYRYPRRKRADFSRINLG